MSTDVEVTTFDAPTTLDNMVLIVEAEMLIHMDYVTNDVMDPERGREGAICGGRKACAIGALWLAHGIKPEIWGVEDDGATLPGIHYDERYDFMYYRPELRRAYDVLNKAATEKADAIAQSRGSENIARMRPEIVRQADMCGMAEALFESNLLDEEGFVGKQLIDVIDRAKELLAPAE